MNNTRGPVVKELTFWRERKKKASQERSARVKCKQEETQVERGCEESGATSQLGRGGGGGG